MLSGGASFTALRLSRAPGGGKVLTLDSPVMQHFRKRSTCPEFEQRVPHPRPSCFVGRAALLMPPRSMLTAPVGHLKASTSANEWHLA